MNMRRYSLRYPILCDCHPLKLASIPHCLLRLNTVSKKTKKIEFSTHFPFVVQCRTRNVYFTLVYRNLATSDGDMKSLFRSNKSMQNTQKDCVHRLERLCNILDVTQAQIVLDKGVRPILYKNTCSVHIRTVTCVKDTLLIDIARAENYIKFSWSFPPITENFAHFFVTSAKLEILCLVLGECSYIQQGFCTFFYSDNGIGRFWI